MTASPRLMGVFYTYQDWHESLDLRKVDKIRDYRHSFSQALFCIDNMSPLKTNDGEMENQYELSVLTR